MRFAFNELKTTQAAAHLLRRHNGTMKYMVLIKLLYLADRKSLIETGNVITGDEMVSMPHGPVLSQVYEFINLDLPEDAKPTPWFEQISREGRYEVVLKGKSPSFDELSRYEMRVLDAIDEQFGQMNIWKLRDYTHTLPEWRDPRGSSLRIDPAEILRAADKSEKEIERISREAEELWLIDTVDPK